MREYARERDVQSFDLQSFLQIVRAVGAIAGVVVIAVGALYAMRVFGLILGVLREPEGVSSLIDRWTAAVGGDQLNLLVSGASFPGARVIAILILGVGTLLLAWISMGLILAGAKTMSWTLGDREAIKRILLHAFGPARKPITGDTADREAGGRMPMASGGAQR